MIWNSPAEMVPLFITRGAFYPHPRTRPNTFNLFNLTQLPNNGQKMKLLDIGSGSNLFIKNFAAATNLSELYLLDPCYAPEAIDKLMESFTNRALTNPEYIRSAPPEIESNISSFFANNNWDTSESTPQSQILQARRILALSSLDGQIKKESMEGFEQTGEPMLNLLNLFANNQLQGHLYYGSGTATKNCRELDFSENSEKTSAQTNVNSNHLKAGEFDLITSHQDFNYLDRKQQFKMLQSSVDALKAGGQIRFSFYLYSEKPSEKLGEEALRGKPETYQVEGIESQLIRA